MYLYHVVAVAFYAAYVAGTVDRDDVAVASFQWVGVVVAVAAVCGHLFDAWHCLFFAVTTLAWDAVFGHWVGVVVDCVAVEAVS